MNDQSEMFDIGKNNGQKVKAWCCNVEGDYELKIFSNGTRHAWGKCSVCGKTNYKQQRLPPSLDELKHKLMSVYSSINSMPKGVDKDEAVAMVERLASDLFKLIS